MNDTEISRRLFIEGIVVNFGGYFAAEQEATEETER